MTDKHNVLFITTDEHPWKCMGYNHLGIKTPNLDRLASQGTIVPFIARAPGQQNANSRTDNLISLVDLPQSFLSYCGLPVPPTMAGVDFAPMFKGAQMGKDPVPTPRLWGA